MTYTIKVKNTREILEANGPRELSETLLRLKSQGLRISTIRRIVVR